MQTCPIALKSTGALTFSTSTQVNGLLPFARFCSVRKSLMLWRRVMQVPLPSRQPAVLKSLAGEVAVRRRRAVVDRRRRRRGEGVRVGRHGRRRRYRRTRHDADRDHDRDGRYGEKEAQILEVVLEAVEIHETPPASETSIAMEASMTVMRQS